MAKRFVMIWFRYLKTDWFTLRKPDLKNLSFVLAKPDHGRMIIIAANELAEKHGIENGLVVADARAIFSSLQVFDDPPGLSEKLLKKLAEWSIRFTPTVAIDGYDGLILDATGCAHLWDNEKIYIENIFTRLKDLGFNVRIAMADTVGAAWGFAHFGSSNAIIGSSRHITPLLSLPVEALRLEAETIERLYKLGLTKISNIISMPRSVLRRRFGQQFLQRLDQVMGKENEIIQPIHLIEPYHERLTCLEPIVTATGIEIALQQLLGRLCDRLKIEGKGLRIAIFKCYRVDNKIQKIDIGTNHPSNNARHLFKLFEIKIATIEPELGIELFTLEAQKVEDVSPVQESLWQKHAGLNDVGLAELLDRIAGKIGVDHLHRFLPDEHHWPERSFRQASSLTEKPTTEWRSERPRPIQLLAHPEPISVAAPIPDYPPMLFRYKGKLHKLIKADGPERIEQEWWLQQGQHRDYYSVEDEEGHRYWLFRLGHYTDETYQWFIHGFFA